MFKSPKEALEKFGREVNRLKQYQDRDDITEIDFTDCHDSVFNAASTGWHIIDWTFKYDAKISDEDKKNNDIFGKFRKEREGECPELSLCGDVANKTKHAVITRFRTADGRTDMATTETSYTGFEVSNRGTRKGVQKCKITLNGQSAVKILDEVFNYWSNYLAPHIDDKLKIPQDSRTNSTFGSVDNVTGNKIINHYGNVPELEYHLNAENLIPEGYEYVYDIEITPPGKSFDSILNSIGLHQKIASTYREVLNITLNQSCGNSSAVQLRLRSNERIVDNGVLFYIR